MTRRLCIIAALLIFSFSFAAAEAAHSANVVYNVSNEKELRKAVDGNEQKTVNISNDITLNRTLRVGDNTVINAAGRTIICNNGAARNKSITKSNFGSMKNITINGGTWKSNYSCSLFQFVHAQNINIANADITCGITGHAIELISCKNVVIRNCRVTGIGKCGKSCVEEQIQIDIATPRTAPTIPRNMARGQTCKNVLIDNCTVSGARAVCANYASREKRFKSKFHKGVTVRRCNLTGTKSEALALFNALDVKVLKCRIKTLKKKKNSPYSVGCHVHLFGKIKGKSGSRRVIIKRNTVYGGRQAIYINSDTSSKYEKATVRNNKAFCRSGKKKAIDIRKVKKKSIGKNKVYKW